MKKQAIITINKQIGFNYETIDKFEAGIKLTGSEVKAVKSGLVNLNGSYVTIELDKNNRPKLILKSCRISKYSKSGYAQKKYDPLRDRELLLTKKEIRSLIGKLGTKGLTLVPISVYNMRRLIKFELALVKGKSKLDKREHIKKRDVNRRIRQKMHT
ncbi:MAG: SsrA-binding protein SmpB [Candidatus Komeilibacteria bacterium]